MNDDLAVRVLGAVELAGPVAGEPAGHEGLPSRLRRLLAALSVSTGAVVSNDRLIEILWGDGLPADPEAALHSLTSRLRTRLRGLTSGNGPAPAVLLTRSPGYLLELRRGALDAQQFEDEVRAAREKLADQPAEAADRLGEALDLWRGPAYAEFADEDFARPEAVRLEQLRVAAFEDRIEAALRCGNHAAAAADLEALVAQEPMRERPHRQLMLALYRGGRQTDALDVARAYRRRLVDELGLDPSEDLQQLEQQILTHDTALEVPVQVPRNAAGSPGPVVPSSRLFGRDDDLDGLAERVRAGSLVTLTGPGGVGKTTLARQAAAQLRSRFADGVVTVELAAVSAGDEVAAAASTALDLRPRADVSPLERVVDSLAGQRRLVVLDNCEHVVDVAADLVEAILGRCPEVAVLATSRSPLDLAGEQVFSVAPLATAPAVDLFAARAGARDRAFVLDAGNAAEVAEICRRLDGLPLAIELAAARVTAMTPAELVRLLSWRFTLLRGGRRTADRHKTLRAVVDWSYDMLDEDSRFAFDVLSVFAGAFTLSEAEALLSSTAAALGRERPAGASELFALLDRSMVSIAPPDAELPTRYVLLETLRAYGRERLRVRDADTDAEMTVQRHHARQLAGMASDAGPLVVAVSQQGTLDRLDAAFDDLRAAWAWSLEHELSTAVRLVVGLASYVELRMPGELESWARRTLDAVDQAPLDGAVEDADLAALLAVAAATARFAGDLSRARKLGERGLTYRSDVGTESYLRYVLLEVALFEGRLEEIDRDAAALIALEPPGMIGPLARMNAQLAAAYRGETDAAIADAEAAYAELSAADDLMTGWAAFVLAEVLLDSDPRRAKELLRASLAEGERWGDRYLQGVVLVAAASLAGRHGVVGEAVPLFLDVIEHWRALGDWLHQWSTLRNVHALLVRADRLTDAAVLHGAIWSRAERFPIFGQDAERLHAAAEQFEQAFGAARFAELCEQGARLRGLEVVELAHRSLLEI